MVSTRQFVYVPGSTTSRWNKFSKDASVSRTPATHVLRCDRSGLPSSSVMTGSMLLVQAKTFWTAGKFSSVHPAVNLENKKRGEREIEKEEKM